VNFDCDMLISTEVQLLLLCELLHDAVGSNTVRRRMVDVGLTNWKGCGRKWS
jgi:hypothetical protein